MSEKKRIYSGKIINLDIEQVTLPNGIELEMEIIGHPGGAAVVAVDDERRVCLLHQYRHVAGGYLWELPAGKIDNEEPPLDTAMRELADEAGVTAAVWHTLGDIISSPGVFAEVVHLWLARTLIVGKTNRDTDEVIETLWLDYEEAVDWAINGRIRDAKSVIGLLRSQPLIGS